MSTAWSSIMCSGKIGDMLCQAFRSNEYPYNSVEASIRTVKVFVNLKGEITSIMPLVLTTDESVMMNCIDVSNGRYNASENRINWKELSDDAKIIFAKYYDEVKFDDIGGFVDESDYSALMVGCNSDGLYDLCVVYHSDMVFKEDAALTIIKDVVVSLNEEGEKIVRVTAYEDGEEVNLIFDDDV